MSITPRSRAQPSRSRVTSWRAKTVGVRPTPARFTAAYDAAPARWRGAARRRRSPYGSQAPARGTYTIPPTHRAPRRARLASSFTTAPPRAPPRPSPCRSLRPTTRRSPRQARGRPRSRRATTSSRRPLSSTPRSRSAIAITLHWRRPPWRSPPTWRLREGVLAFGQHRHDYRQLRGADRRATLHGPDRNAGWSGRPRCARLTYTNSSDTPSEAARSIRFVINDGVENSAVAAKTVSVPQ